MNAPIELLKRAGNEALRVNPTVADIDITTHGSDFLWAVFSVMAATGLGTMIWSLKLSRGERAFHYLSAAILATASVAYFSMASDLGATPVTVEFTNYGPAEVNGARPTRSIWYARYIDWTITTPLLLLEILLVSGLPLSTIFVTIFFDLVMIITGLIGALVQSTYKWGYYTMGCVAMFYVFWVIYGPGLKSAAHLGDDFKKAYLYSSLLLTILWTLYPVSRISGWPAPFPRRAARTSTNHHIFYFYLLFNHFFSSSSFMNVLHHPTPSPSSQTCFLPADRMGSRRWQQHNLARRRNGLLRCS